MDNKQKKLLISFLMDASDVIERAKQEFRTARENGLIFTEEEHEAITDLVNCMESDIDILAEYNKPYMRFGKNSFAVMEQK